MEEKAGIPQVKGRFSLIKEISTDGFWADITLLQLEYVRKELRELMKFLIGDTAQKSIVTRLTDPILEEQEGVQLDAA